MPRCDSDTIWPMDDSEQVLSESHLLEIPVSYVLHGFILGERQPPAGFRKIIFFPPLIDRSEVTGAVGFHIK